MLFAKRFIGYIIASLLTAVPIAANSQFSISGTVTEADTKTPLQGASVFLDNATKGASTGSDGKFVISGIKAGQYNIVVTMVGYQTTSIAVLVNSDLQDVQFELQPKVSELKPVIVISDKLRQRYFEIFKREFLGKTANAASCKIVNPEIIDYEYDNAKDILKASTEEFLIVENASLGYRIKFLLNKFSYTRNVDGTYLMYYEGQTLFEEIQGNNGKKKRWAKNRMQAYWGSNMHFLRAALTNKVLDEGFVMHTLIRKPNPERPPEDIIQTKLIRFRNEGTIASKERQDSLSYWQKKADMPKTVQYLIKDTLKVPDVVKRTDQTGLHALKFQNALYVLYSKNKAEYLSAFYHPLDEKALPYSVINLVEEYALFDGNGVILNPQSVVFEGSWGQRGTLAEMLPSDYEPLTK